MSAHLERSTGAHLGAFLMGNRMLKRLLLALVMAGLWSSAHAAGTIPLSLSQQLDSLGKPLINCYLYIYQAGTVATPQNAYQDSALTIATANPMRCNSAGRLSQFFLADGTVKVRLTDQSGVTQLVADGVQVIGPSGGGGGGSSVDATTVLATGDFKTTYGTGTLSGFVRCNGRTIGSATSGASERANADTSALFTYLWTNDSNLAVSTGRGASAAADFAANKTLTLPDCRGRVIAGLDDMGSTAAGRLTSTFFGVLLVMAPSSQELEPPANPGRFNLPPYTPSGGVSGTAAIASTGLAVSGGATSVYLPSGGVGLTLPLTASFTGNAQGGTSAAFSNVMPAILTTVFIKL